MSFRSSTENEIALTLSLSQILIVGIGKGWSSYQQAPIPLHENLTCDYTQ